MSKQLENFYGINYQEGSRGSFIGDMIVHIKEEITSEKYVIDAYGNGGGLCRSILGSQISIDETLPYPQNQYSYALNDNSPYDFITIPGFPIHRLDLEKVTASYKNWKVIHIVYEPNECIDVHLLNWNKNYSNKLSSPRSNNYYQKFYDSVNDQIRLSSNDLNDLDINELKHFFKFYQQNNRILELNNRIHDSATWKLFLKNRIPSIYHSRIFTLKFSDITNDMNSTLDLLSEVTEIKISPMIKDLYKQYLDGQPPIQR